VIEQCRSGSLARVIEAHLLQHEVHQQHTDATMVQKSLPKASLLEPNMFVHRSSETTLVMPRKSSAPSSRADAGDL
jgi:hypothetical protein